jgi:hypothetical protein
MRFPFDYSFVPDFAALREEFLTMLMRVAASNPDVSVLSCSRLVAAGTLSVDNLGRRWGIQCSHFVLFETLLGLALSLEVCEPWWRQDLGRTWKSDVRSESGSPREDV